MGTRVETPAGAAATCAVLVAGLLTVVPANPAAATRVEFAAVQLQAAPRSFAVVAAPDAAVESVTATGEAAPRANAETLPSSQVVISSLISAGIVLAVTPLWYVGFAVTLPATFGALIYLDLALSWGFPQKRDPAELLVNTVKTWAMVPIWGLETALGPVIAPISTPNSASSTVAARSPRSAASAPSSDGPAPSIATTISHDGPVESPAAPAVATDQPSRPARSRAAAVRRATAAADKADAVATERVTVTPDSVTAADRDRPDRDSASRVAPSPDH